MSLDKALETLANYRANNTRASNDTVQKGRLILQKKSALKKLGDECERVFSTVYPRALTDVF